MSSNQDMSMYAMHKDHDDMFYHPSDIANGSYGPDIDKYLGRSPVDGPPGYVFQKVTYTAGADAGRNNVSGSYKLCSDHNGYIYHLTGTYDANALETTGENLINEDGADASADPASMGEAKLVSGDKILGAILQLVDTRTADNRTGQVAAGLVSHESASPDVYGPKITGDPSNFVVGSAISGARISAANGLKSCAVASPNLNVYSPAQVAVEASDLGPASIGAPINAITVSGISPNGTSNQIRFALHVYALVGPRQKTISHYTQPDPEFRLSCLTKKVCKHPVAMVY